MLVDCFLHVCGAAFHLQTCSFLILILILLWFHSWKMLYISSLFFQEKTVKKSPALRMARCTWTGIFGSPRLAKFVSVTTELFFAMKSSVKMCWSVRTHRCPQGSAVLCVPIRHEILTTALVRLLSSSLFFERRTSQAGLENEICSAVVQNGIGRPWWNLDLFPISSRNIQEDWWWG